MTVKRMDNVAIVATKKPVPLAHASRADGRIISVVAT